MSATLRARALDAAGLIAERLADPDAVATHVEAIPSDGPDAWDDHSLTRGAAALALVAAEADRPTSATTLTAAWRRTAAATAQDAVAGPFGGLGALASLARCIEAPPTVMERLDARLSEHARWLSTALRARVDAGDPAYAGTVDTLGGLAGEGRYLLARGHPAAADVVEALAPLTRPLKVDGLTVPGWWSAPTERTVVAPEFDRGRLCFGLAHGVGGPLMFLALAKQAGLDSPTLDQTLTTLTEELWSWRDDDEHGPYWTPYRPLDHLRRRPGRRPDPARASWCYGSFGLAVVLDQVGRAIGQQNWRVRAREVALAQLRRPPNRLGLRDPGLCHGWSGHLFLIDTLCRSGILDGSNDLVTRARAAAAEHTLSALDADHPFAIRMPHPATGEPRDLPGLLEGAAGVALALLAYGRDELPRTRWDTLLLLR